MFDAHQACGRRGGRLQRASAAETVGDTCVDHRGLSGRCGTEIVGVNNNHGGSMARQEQAVLARRHWLAAGAGLAASLCLWMAPAAPAAAALVVAPTSLSVVLGVGAEAVVLGDITNSTGVALVSDELIGSFSGFAADSLVITQLLGLMPVNLPDRSLTRGLELFSISLGPDAVAGAVYQFAFSFSDPANNFSDPVVFSVTAAGVPNPVPEPATWLLVAGSLAAMAVRRQRPVPQGV